MTIEIKTFFDQDTATFTHVVYDISTKLAAIIDSVLNYDQYSGKYLTKSADQIIEFVNTHDLKTEWILETHIHADHLTASSYLKEKLGGKIGIGSKIKDVLSFWVPLFNTSEDTPLDGSQFDCLFEDNQIISLGNSLIRVLHTPGHTPACSSYLIDDCIFVGDTIFMTDIGTARTDFPGGSADTLYNSIKKILSLPLNTKIYLCHDYPPSERDLCWLTSVSEQKNKNILIHDGISKEEYIQKRIARDEGKPVPKLLLPSIQVNLRAGSFGVLDKNQRQFIKIPINSI